MEINYMHFVLPALILLELIVRNTGIQIAGAGKWSLTTESDNFCNGKIAGARPDSAIISEILNVRSDYRYQLQKVSYFDALCCCLQRGQTLPIILRRIQLQYYKSSFTSNGINSFRNVRFSGLLYNQKKDTLIDIWGNIYSKKDTFYGSYEKDYEVNNQEYSPFHTAYPDNLIHYLLPYENNAYHNEEWYQRNPFFCANHPKPDCITAAKQKFCSAAKYGEPNMYLQNPSLFVQHVNELREASNNCYCGEPSAHCGHDSQCCGESICDRVNCTCNGLPPTTTLATVQSTFGTHSTPHGKLLTTPLSYQTTTQNPELGQLNGLYCNVSDCNIKMNCKTFVACIRNDQSGNPDQLDGTTKAITCKKNYFTLAINVTNAEPGENVVVACIIWNELPQKRKDEILNDIACSYCRVIPVDGECSTRFLYRDGFGNVGSVVHCPNNMVIDIKSSSCIAPCETVGDLLVACKKNGKC